jgi:hypothetical protein
VNRVIWPWSLFCTVLPITEVDGYRIIQHQPPGGIKYVLSCVLVAALLSLLALAVYFRNQDDVVASLTCAGAFAAALLTMLAIAHQFTRCKRCRRRMRSYQRAHFHHQGQEYRLTGWKCDHCREVDIGMCVNMALESAS